MNKNKTQNNNTQNNKSIQCFLLVNNHWIEYNIVELITALGFNEDSLMRALNNKSEQGWGRVKSKDNTLYIVSWNTPKIKSIEEQKNNFAKWYVDNYKLIYAYFRKSRSFNTTSNEDIEDLIGEAMLYCVKQIDLGYGINHYLKTITFKVKKLAIDNFRRTPPNVHIIIVENENKQDESEPDFIEYEVREPRTVYFSDVLEEDECHSDDMKFCEKIKRIETETDNTIVENMNYDVKNQVLQLFLSASFNELEINIWRQVALNKQVNSKQLKYKEVGKNNGITINVLKTVKEICSRIDKHINANLNTLTELYNNFKYKTFDEHDMLC